jgi:electron transport complex protein RnfG
MKRIIVWALAAFLSTGMAAAQHHHGNCGNCPHHQQHQSQQCQQQPQGGAPDMAVVKAFPTAKKLGDAAKGAMTPVLDAQDKVLGYVVYSKPASDGIKGYAGETPVLIAFDGKKVITGVYLLQNRETPKFVKRVEDAGFFKSWNGLTVKKAVKKDVDVVSGATYTSNGVSQSVRAALKALK